MNDTKTSFSNKRVAVLGYGVEGKSVVDFLRKEGAVITVFDEKENPEGKEVLEGIEGVEFKRGTFPDLSQFDIIVHSPGIRPDIPVLASKKVITPTNIFFERCPCPVIGITGTKGKGTTSALIYEMLKEDKKDAYLGGNIGTSPLDFLPKLTKNSIVVFEMSSFQLMDCSFSPHIAVIVMVVPEHQDWHTSVDEYVKAKSNIFTHQHTDDTTVINMDYPLNRQLLPLIPGKVMTVSMIPHTHSGCFVSDNDWLIFQHQGQVEQIIKGTEIKLPGRHNWENASAATSAAKAAGISTKSIRKVLKTFPGLPYRLEKVKEVDGVLFYNDSFSTTPETTIAAIKSFAQPKILILGGSSKQSNFAELGRVIQSSDSIRGIIGIGEEWKRIKQSIKHQASSIKVIEDCATMADVVKRAHEMAQAGDVVLLSPGCASFGMFKNYKDRGNQFREEVEKLPLSS